MYVLDTIASIEAGTKAVTSPRDMRHFLLPAPAPIWNARNAQEWLEAMTKYKRTITLDEMLHKTFDLRAPSIPQAGPGNAGAIGSVGPLSGPSASSVPYSVEQAFTSHNSAAMLSMSSFGQGVQIHASDCLGTRIPMGPFSRLCVVLTLLRGLVEFGEGKRKGGQVTQIWAVWPEPLERPAPPLSGAGADRAALEANTLATYKRAFDRVRANAMFTSVIPPS